MEKTCSKCAIPKPLKEFHRSTSRGKFGVEAICRVCSKAKTMAWRAANPGGHAAIQARYRAAHPERVTASQDAWRAKFGTEYERARYTRRQSDPAQKKVYRSGQQAAKSRRRAGGPLTAATVRDVLSKPCAYCGGLATEVEHILPVSRGGTNARENLAASCKSCNQSKASKTPEEWRVRATK